MKGIIKIFYAPQDAFKEIKERQINLWIPFLLLLALYIIITLLYVNYIVYPRRMEFLHSGQIPPNAVERAQKFFSRPFMNIMSFLQTLIGVPVVILATATVYHFSVGFLGGESRFNFAFLYVTYSKFINLLAHYTKFPIALLKNNPKVHTDLAIFFPFLKGRNFLYILLSQVDIFTLYSLYVIACGMVIFSKVEKKKALIFVYSLWFLITLVLSLLGFLRGRRFVA